MAAIQMDYERCAAVHNEILKQGVEGIGQDFNAVGLTTFWDTVTDYHDQLIAELKPSIIEFYKRALVYPSQNEPDSPYQCFFYFVRELYNPLQDGYYRDTLQCENQDAKQADDDPERYLLLYIANNLESHEMGIVFDQEKCLATMKMSLWSTEFEDLDWHPLETVLQGYVDMIEMGKVTAINTKTFEYQHSKPQLCCGETEPYPPWVVHSSSDQILNRALQAYYKLLQAIEDRMPLIEHRHPQSDAQAFLATENMLAAGGFPHRGFTRSFLLHAPMPRKQIRHIAPGIRLPDYTSVVHQPFRDVGNDFPNADNVRRMAAELNISASEEDVQQGATYMPILLFPADIDIDMDTGDRPPADDIEPFQYPFNDKLSHYPCGLWIREADTQSNQPYEDETMLMLPFAFGGAGHARTSDGKTIEPASRMQLYQRKANPFVENHGIQLYLLLENWIERIEKGDWEVGENGVMGGIEKFKEADESEKLSRRYRVALSW